jgi:hypothetical protein
MRQRPTAEQQEAAFEQDMLNKLATLARGVDPVTCLPISMTEMMDAQKQYHELKNQIDQRRIQREKISQEVQIETMRQETQRELEHRRLDIEEERVKIQKAEVIVRALEVAAKQGVDPQALLGAIRELGTNLLPGPATALLETKSD